MRGGQHPNSIDGRLSLSNPSSTHPAQPPRSQHQGVAESSVVLSPLLLPSRVSARSRSFSSVEPALG